MEITKEMLISAMCSKSTPCGAHRQSAEKIWAILEKFAPKKEKK